MKKTFDSKTRAAVLGVHSLGEYEVFRGSIGRTPLHVNFGPGPDFAPSRPAEGIEDRNEFNAVGSRGAKIGPEGHLPVLDLDGGGTVQSVNVGSKAILYAIHKIGFQSRRPYVGKYGPNSILRDVLGDHRLDLEVFESLVGQGIGSPIGSAVTAIVLRSKERDMFAAVDSTQEGHSHLYIQNHFNGADHGTLLGELARIGILDKEWLRLAEQEGMGIVRAPWTKREGVEKRSSGL